MLCIRNDWNNYKKMLILAVTMAFASVLIFVVVLGQAMPTWSGEYFSAFFSKIWSLFSSARGRFRRAIPFVRWRIALF